MTLPVAGPGLPKSARIQASRDHQLAELCWRYTHPGKQCPNAATTDVGLCDYCHTELRGTP